MFSGKNNLFETIKKCEEIEEMLKEITLCFTGHRSQKLPWRFNENDERCLNMKTTAKSMIENAVKDGFIYFISGMAIGFDMICAEIVLELKKTYPNIKLVCAIPCKDQDKFWNNELKNRYKNILNNADIVRYISN